MASRDTGTPEEPNVRRRKLLARREGQRERRLRRARRRRLVAAGILGAAAIAVVVILLMAPGDESDGNTAGGRTLSGSARQKSTTHAEVGSSPVRNATPQPGWEPHLGPVPILEYHVLGAAPADALYPELYVTRPDFHREMDWLDRHGYQAVTLEEVEDDWYDGGTLPARPVVVSFDDGYRPQFTYALPELRRHGWPGVLNLKAEGSDLYESNVRAMIDAGWELASHTIDHSDLTTLDSTGLERELDESRQLLRQEYGVPVKDFCYPAGRFDPTVIAAVEAAGYETATTEIPGYADPGSPYELARFEILGSTGVGGMAADLEAH